MGQSAKGASVVNDASAASAASAASVTGRPEWGTALIRCCKTNCKWRGLETDMVQVNIPRSDPTSVQTTQSACPLCGCNSYMFMTPGEIKAWQQKITIPVACSCTGHALIRRSSHNVWFVICSKNQALTSDCQKKGRTIKSKTAAVVAWNKLFSTPAGQP